LNKNTGLIKFSTTTTTTTTTNNNKTNQTIFNIKNTRQQEWKHLKTWWYNKFMKLLNIYKEDSYTTRKQSFSF